MKKWIFLLKSFLLIILTSGVCSVLFGKIEQSSATFYQANLLFKLKDNNPRKDFIDQIRYLLLYENNTIEKLSKEFELPPDIIAGNLKILMKSDQVHFAVMFKSKNKTIAKRIVQRAGQVIQQQPEIKQDGVLKIQQTKKQHIKVMLIGLIVGFFGGIGVILLLLKNNNYNCFAKRLLS